MNKYWSRRLDGIEAYTPGEQPKIPGLIKLNTNENPYDPSPKALAALASAATADMRLYPDPDAHALRDVLAETHGLAPDQIFVGNGSDEVLAFSFLAFFDAGRPLLFPDITYSFYPVYGDFFGIDYERVPLDADFQIPVSRFCRTSGGVIFPNPNAPTGIALPLVDVERIVAADPDRVVIVDEAYVDFGADSAVELIRRYPNVLVIQTLSKYRALAGLRLGWAMGDRGLVEALACVKNCINSYTIDRAAQAAAAAAVSDRAYYEETAQKIIATRERTAAALRSLNVHVLPSSANFLFAAPPDGRGEEVFQKLRERKILVRYFQKPRISRFLRITIGTDQEMDVLLAALEEILESPR